MLARSSAHSLRQTMTEEIEGWPGLVKRGRLSDAVEKNFVGVGVLHGEFELAFASFREGVGLAKSGEEVGAGAGANRAEKSVAVAVAFIKRGSGGCGSLGDAAHGERFFAASCPEPAGGVKNALCAFLTLAVLLWCWCFAVLRVGQLNCSLYHNCSRVTIDGDALPTVQA